MTLEELGLDTPGFTPEYVRARIHYESATGVFTWLKHHRNAGFTIGKRAGHINRGYWVIEMDGVKYKAHRLAWFWMTGAWPSQTIDHIDRNRGNNRWSNLREATENQQSHNRGLLSSNTSGVAGAYFNYKMWKWEAKITVNYKKIHLGVFDTLEEAAEARKAAEEKLLKEQLEISTT